MAVLPSASEVTTVWRYRNSIIIIIITRECNDETTTNHLVAT